jgi:hypothetical protein
MMLPEMLRGKTKLSLFRGMILFLILIFEKKINTKCTSGQEKTTVQVFQHEKNKPKINVRIIH